VYDCVAENPAELSFNKGAIITNGMTSYIKIRFCLKPLL